jgi:hypothetical protein
MIFTGLEDDAPQAAMLHGSVAWSAAHVLTILRGQGNPPARAEGRWFASFYECPLDARIMRLPLPQFAYATRLMYALGWVDWSR